MNQLKKDMRCYGIGIFLALGTMASLQFVFHSVCLFRILFGIPCPACGMTRAFFFLLQGEIQKALWMHPLFPFVLFIGCHFIWHRYFQKYSGKYPKKYVIILLVGSLFLYGFRMICFFPSREPMTYEQKNLLFMFLWRGKGF